MKLILGNLVTIMIREEDFVEVNVEGNIVSYTRPNGSKAIIKLPQNMKMQNEPEAQLKESTLTSQRLAAAEIRRQKQQELWAEEQTRREQRLREQLFENSKNLETRLKLTIESLQIKTKEDLAKDQSELKRLKEEINTNKLISNTNASAEKKLEEEMKILKQNIDRWFAEVVEKVNSLEIKNENEIKEVETRIKHEAEKEKEQPHNPLSDIRQSIDICWKHVVDLEKDFYSDTRKETIKHQPNLGKDRRIGIPLEKFLMAPNHH